MTTSGQLHLNVIAAPVAAVDRRALSQAWYSALYGAGQPRQAKAQAASRQASSTRGGIRPFAQMRPEKRIASSPPRVANAKYRESASAAAQQPERRRAPLALARRIHKTFAGKAAVPPQSATFSLGKKGRVHVVLHRAGPRLRLVALCSRSAGANVMRAIGQARYALAARGIALETHVEEMVRL